MAKKTTRKKSRIVASAKTTGKKRTTTTRKKSTQKKSPAKTPAVPTTKRRSEPLNQGLSAARSAKKDEFYTQYIDIQKEVEAYLEYDPDTFRGKIVYCNSDDPF